MSSLAFNCILAAVCECILATFVSGACLSLTRVSPTYKCRIQHHYWLILLSYFSIYTHLHPVSLFKPKCLLDHCFTLFLYISGETLELH